MMCDCIVHLRLSNIKITKMFNAIATKHKIIDKVCIDIDN